MSENHMGSASSLKELPFKDLYVRVDDEAGLYTESRYNPLPAPDYDGFANKPVPEQYAEDINMLRTTLKKPVKDDFAVSHDGIRLRVARYETVSKTGAETWAAMRRFPSVLPKLENLGFRPDILEAMRSFGKRTGIIIVGGATGAGKSTTVVGMLREYLKNNGGLLYTVEDPVEYLMQGPFSENPDNAFILQREVSEEDEWALATAAALRSAPKYIFLGEIRTPAAARQALRAANSGHLVICTVHGGSVEQTLSAVIQIAERELGPLAPILLADGLCAVLHQELINGKPNVTMIQTKDRDLSDKVRSNIRNNKLMMLSSDIQSQAINRSKQVAREPASPVQTKPGKTGTGNKGQVKKKGGLFGGLLG